MTRIQIDDEEVTTILNEWFQKHLVGGDEHDGPDISMAASQGRLRAHFDHEGLTILVLPKEEN